MNERLDRSVMPPRTSTPPSKPPPKSAPKPAPVSTSHPRPAGRAGVPVESAVRPDYDRIVEQMKTRYVLRVRRWRRAMSGCAWRTWYADGRSINWVEAPYPKTPISLAIFLHEVGHHAIGFDRYRTRCEEEYAAWRWSIDTMTRLGVTPDARVWTRYERSMRYAVAKAMRRGLKRLPAPLLPFTRAG